MLNSVSAGPGPHLLARQASAPTAEGPVGVKENGKANSVGHQAKAAIAEARAAGIDLPKNIQGQVASSIARGIDPASLFDAIVDPLPVETAPVEGEGLPVTEEPAAGGGDIADLPVTNEPPLRTDPVTEVPIGDASISAAQTALALLENVESTE